MRNRDSLLESTAHETRKLADLLEKERGARQKDRVHFDQMTRSQQSLTKTIKENDTRAMEIENHRNNDRRRFSEREQQYREQLFARNNLLLSVWNRLSTLCGAEFVQKHGLVLPEQQLPSIEVIARNLTGFGRTVNLAVKTVEALMNGFNSRIKEVERNLWKDFQTLEHAMDVRTKRIDALEKMVEDQEKAFENMTSAGHGTNGSVSINPRGSSKRDSTEFTRLKQENKLLKAELSIHRAPSPIRENPRGHSHNNSVEAAVSAMPLPGNDPITFSRQRDSRSGRSESRSNRSSVAASLLRHHSTSAGDAQQLLHLQSDRPVSRAYTPPTDSPTRRAQHPPSQIPGPQGSRPGSSATLQPSEQRWVHRLKELERRLKSEREARLLDRSDARKRLEHEAGERDELRRQLEMERELRREPFDEAGSPDHQRSAERLPETVVE